MMRQIVCIALVAMLLVSGAYAAIKCYSCQPNQNNNYCSETAKGGWPAAATQVSCSGYCLSASGNMKLQNNQPDQRFTIADCMQQDFADALGVGSGANQCKNGDEAKQGFMNANRFTTAYSLPRGNLDYINYCKCSQDLCNSAVSITSTSVSIAVALMSAVVVKMFY